MYAKKTFVCAIGLEATTRRYLTVGEVLAVRVAGTARVEDARVIALFGNVDPRSRNAVSISVSHIFTTYLYITNVWLLNGIVYDTFFCNSTTSHYFILSVHQ